MFKIVSEVEQNAFYNEKCNNNGGGYHQPLITFVFNGVEGVIDDTSCGDFGSRYTIKYGRKYYSHDTINGEDDASNLNPKHPKDKMLIHAIYHNTGYMHNFAVTHKIIKWQ